MHNPMTESTGWQNKIWQLEPLKSISVSVEAPSLFTDFRNVEFGKGLPNLFTLILPERDIDPLTHQEFLKESINTYGEIWRELSKI